MTAEPFAASPEFRAFKKDVKRILKVSKPELDARVRHRERDIATGREYERGGTEAEGTVTHIRFAALIALIALHAAIGATIQQSNMTPQHTSATADSLHSSNIQSLTAEKNRLQDKVDRWNIGYIIALCIAIVVGISTAFAQWKTISLSRRLASSQSLIEGAKDRESREELGKRDAKIAELNDSSAKTIERAGKLELQAESLRADAERSRSAIASAQADAAKASQRAAEAESHLGEASARVKEAEARIADAVSKVASADARIAEANGMAAEANRVAEAERLERIRLQAAVAPRSLSLEEQRQLADSIRSFNSHRVVVSSYGLDGEGAGLATQILLLLRSALGDDNVLDSRASIVTTGGFELGVHINGPESEEPFIMALSAALTSIGHLSIFVNQPAPRFGNMIMGGGHSFPNGTVFVSVLVGIRPVSTLPR